MGQIRMLRLLCLLLILLLAACGSEADKSSGTASGDSAVRPDTAVEAQPTIKATDSAELAQEQPLEPTSTASPSPSITPVPTATAVISALAQGEPSVVDYGIDLACFGTWGHGATCLNNAGEWQKFTEATSPIGSDFIIDIDSCENGVLLFLHGSGVSIFDGQEWTEYPGEWGFDSPEAIACAGNDDFWVAHFRGVSYFNGEIWFYINSANLSFGDEATDLIKDVVVDDEDRAWIVSMNSITLYDGYGWVIYQLGQGFSEKYFFEAIALDEEARPWVVHSHGLSTNVAGSWELLQNENLFNLQDVAVDQDGRIWVATQDQGLAIFDGSTWQIRDRMSGDLDSNNVNKIEVDDAGRVWAATAYGLHLFDGQNRHVFRMENADLADNSIRAIGISGTPRLPELQEKETGSISGSIVDENGPYALKIIEACVEATGNFYEGQTPCSSQPFRRTEVTDGAGDFSFAGLPPGAYVLSIQTEDGWQQASVEFGFDNGRVPVSPGQNSDVGVLTISEEGG